MASNSQDIPVYLNNYTNNNIRDTFIYNVEVIDDFPYRVGDTIVIGQDPNKQTLTVDSVYLDYPKNADPNFYVYFY